MESERTYTRVPDASAWKGQLLCGNREWLMHVDDDNIRDTERALASIRDRGLAMEEIQKKDFSLPRLQGALLNMATETESGRGFAVLRGLPIELWGLEDAMTVTGSSRRTSEHPRHRVSVGSA